MESSTAFSANSLPMRIFKPKGTSHGGEQRAVLSNHGHISVQEETFVARDADVFPDGGKDDGSTFSTHAVKQSDYTVNGVAGTYSV